MLYIWSPIFAVTQSSQLAHRKLTSHMSYGITQFSLLPTSRHNPRQSWFSIHLLRRNEKLTWLERVCVNILLKDVTRCVSAGTQGRKAKSSNLRDQLLTFGTACLKMFLLRTCVLLNVQLIMLILVSSPVFRVLVFIV